MLFSINSSVLLNDTSAHFGQPCFKLTWFDNFVHHDILNQEMFDRILKINKEIFSSIEEVDLSYGG